MNTNAAQANDIATRILEFLRHAEECPIPPEQLLPALAQLRESGTESTVQIARMMMDIIERQGGALNSLQEVHEHLRELIKGLTAPPYFSAVFLGAANTLSVEGAVVQTENDRRVVQLGEGVQVSELLPGDEVYLSHERNCLMAKAGGQSCLTGDVAAYSRTIADGRIVLRARDEELVVLPTARLRNAALKAGDGVRFDRSRGLAFEQIEASKGEEYFLEATPNDSYEEVGGLDREIAILKRMLTLHVVHPFMTIKYKLRRKKAVLMEGPPGNGKTKVARATCAWLASQSRSGRSHFINIKPGALNSMWYGATEQKYREIFRAARDAATAAPDDCVVMFFDEVDAVGNTRGESIHRIDDRMLTCFMAELNGLEDRGNIVVLAATNRRDALDPALVRPGRLGDLILHFPQPNRQAARAILSRHMPADIPYAANGEGPAAAREALLDLAVGQIYSEHRDTELANVTLRDGKQRLVRAADLVSGAQLESIAQAAIERACVRETEGGPEGLSRSDMDAAIADFFMVTPRGLTPRNARNYLHNLPQDVDVVRVDVVERKVTRPHRYRVEAA